MSNHKPLTVAEALSPHRRIHKRPRIQLVACPICRRRMSTILLDSHIDRCKPRRCRSSPPTTTSTQSTTPPSTQSSTPPPTAPHQPSSPSPSQLTQSHLTPLPQPPALYFILSHHLICASFRHSPCSTCATTPPSFSALILLRSYSHHPATTHLHLHQCEPSKPLFIPALPAGSPASRLPHSILLSALQKCIRRRLAYPAVRIAVTIIRKRRSLFDLLRRLTVIALEDAVLHPNFPELVWLFAAAGKAHRPCKEDLHLILNAVYQLAAVKARDVGVRSVTREEVEGEEHWIQALRVRACYGGMSGDTVLLKAAANLWTQRLQEEGAKWREFLGRLFGEEETGVVPEERWMPLFQENESVLRPGDIPPAAWDMHCCSITDDISKSVVEGNGEIVERFGGELDGVRMGIENLMWKYRSSISNKRAFEGLEEGLKVEEEAFVMEDNVCKDADEVLWKTEVEGLVNEWCRKHRRRYGL